MSKYRLEYVESGTAPVAYLASFPSGVPSDDCFDPESDDKVVFRVFANTAKRKAHQVGRDIYQV